jgi:phytoene synthase
MTTELSRSYAACQQLARQAQSNFYGAFGLLPRPKRLAMCALYAYLRRADDLGDAPAPAAERRRGLTELRQALHSAVQGQFSDPFFPALADVINRFGVPVAYLEAVLDGVEMDLEPRSYQTFADLEVYCQRVASVVGQACLFVWGFDGSQHSLELAHDCGLAFQLTNTLRDLQEDAELGRVYLPVEDLARFRYSAEDLRTGVVDERLRALMNFEAERAEAFYERGRQLSERLSADGRPVFGAMFSTYRSLLREIRRRDGQVFGPRIRLAAWRKWAIGARWIWPRARVALGDLGSGARLRADRPLLEKF